MRLSGMLAVILGAGGADNIGQAIARRFAREGAELVIGGRSIAALQPLASELGARAAACDITDPHALGALFAAAGRPADIAINTVGRNLFRPFMQTTAEDMDALCRVHLTGPLLFTQAAVQAMAGKGSIVHISSITAKLVMADHVAYMATKAAGEVLVRAAAHEFGPRGIRVNAIAPALTRTPMTRAIFADPALIASSAAASPLRRLGTVEDVAAAAVWLASDECFMTGETLQINGGLALHTITIT